MLLKQAFSLLLEVAAVELIWMLTQRHTLAEQVVEQLAGVLLIPQAQREEHRQRRVTLEMCPVVSVMVLVVRLMAMQVAEEVCMVVVLVAVVPATSEACPLAPHQTVLDLVTVMP